MLTQVIVQSSTPMTLKVEDIVPTEILFLKGITGLSPEGLTLFTGDFARDGGYYQGRRIGQRNVVFTFKLNPDYTNNVETSDIRELLYKTFLEPLPASDAVQVLLDDDRKPDRYFIGYCEAINTDMWSQTQEAQVSLLCVDPYIRSSALTTFTDASGVISTPFTYDGSADTGLKFQIKVATANQNIFVKINNDIMQLQHPTTYAINDIIDVDTSIGTRSIKLTRSAVTTDVMAHLQTTGVPWLQLKEAANTISTYGTTAADGKTKIMSYSYRSAWWGV